MRFRWTIGWGLRLVALAAANLGLARYLYVNRGPHTRGSWLALAGFLVALNLGAAAILFRSHPAGGPWSEAQLRRFRIALVVVLLVIFAAAMLLAARV